MCYRCMTDYQYIIANTCPSRCLQGQYEYELFSIMIHSGSAVGGHYYAYIKYVVSLSFLFLVCNLL